MSSIDTSGSTLTIGVISEIHCTPAGTPNVPWHNELRFDLGLAPLETALAAIVGHSVDAIAVLGDLTHYADSESNTRVRRMLKTSGKPVIALSGNHDITAAASSPSAFRNFFTDDWTCTPPLTTSFHGIPVQLLGVVRDPDTNLLASLGPALSLSAKEFPVIMSHYPLLPLATTLSAAGLKHAGDLTDLDTRTDELHSLARPAVVLHGHLHVRETTVFERVLHLSFAALVEPPHEYSILTLSTSPDGGLEVSRQSISAHSYDVEMLPVLSPDRESWEFIDGTWMHEKSNIE